MVGSTLSSSEPELAQFVVDQLSLPLPHLTTIRRDRRRPRAHPVTPIVTDTPIFVLLEPTSPTPADRVVRRHFALRTRVHGTAGTGGEALLTDKADRYGLVDLLPTEVKVRGASTSPGPHRCHGH